MEAVNFDLAELMVEILGIPYQLDLDCGYKVSSTDGISYMMLCMDGNEEGATIAWAVSALYRVADEGQTLAFTYADDIDDTGNTLTLCIVEVDTYYFDCEDYHAMPFNEVMSVF